MTREQLDKATFDGTITTGTNEIFTVNTSRADDVLVLIDDGSQDGQPASYDMTQRVYTAAQDATQFYDQVTGSTSRSFTDPAWGDQMEYEFNNQSGSNATYRITILSYRKVD